MNRIIFVVTILLQISLIAAAQDLYRVPEDYPTIQAAVDATGWNTDMILIAPGTYTGEGNRDIHIDRTTYPADLIISGDGAPGDIVIDAKGGPNDPHRVFNMEGDGTSVIILKNVTVRGGYIDEEKHGAGILVKDFNLNISNCIIENNESFYAAEDGGGIHADANSYLECYDVIFQFNTSSFSGGAICSDYSSLTNCVFRNNSASDFGAVLIRRSGTVVKCNFTENTAKYNGGGLGFKDYAFVNNCKFENNVAGISGGGLECEYSIYLDVTNCIFNNNVAAAAAGCNFWAAREVLLSDCLFSNNSAIEFGGGAFSMHGTWLNVNHCTFYNNSSLESGGSVFFRGLPYVNIANSIFWNNTSAQGDEMSLFYVDEVQLRTDVTLSYCVFPDDAVFVDDDCSITYGDGMINIAPELAGPDSNDFTLSSRSPCIDNGRSDEDNPVDLAGNPRPVGSGVDIGAYEFQTVMQPGAYLIMDNPDLTAGDQLKLNAVAITGEPARDVLLVAALEIDGLFFFHPDWTLDVTSEPMTIRFGRQGTTILDFPWPEGAGECDNLTFWGAIMDPTDMTIIGAISQLEWRYY